MQQEPTTSMCSIIYRSPPAAVQATHSVVKEDESQQDVVDPGTDLSGGQRFQGRSQRLHALRDQMNAICLHRARQEPQQAGVPERLQVL